MHPPSNIPYSTPVEAGGKVGDTSDGSFDSLKWKWEIPSKLSQRSACNPEVKCAKNFIYNPPQKGAPGMEIYKRPDPSWFSPGLP